MTGIMAHNLGVRHRRVHAVEAALAIGLALAGCTSDGSADLEDRAADNVRKYLAAVEQPPDHGWSLLSAGAQHAWESREAYRSVAGAVDWTAFEVHVVDGLVCHDGTTCSVCLEVTSPTEAIPGFLRASPRLEDGIALTSGLDCGNATIGVYLAPEPWSQGGLMVTPKP